MGVPPLEAWVRERTAHYDEGFVSADPAFAHAHVTVLAPFPVGATDRAAAAASEVRAFDYTLRRVATFPDGVVHLVPEPDRGFRALTDAARRLVPEVAPYWGRFEPVPHVTLDRLGPGVTESSTRDAVAHLLPCRARASELLLTWWEDGGCRVLGRFPLSS
ncbi:2'-5' RNA ligase family protein [Propioniciclava sp. MC1683]|uniref:2'-5' RNA ligase family protein n=1 Tax=Propioniciclava sp. MC1683 TaxID=2760309 RepID=UPI002814DAF6|nr:2'-5' RNA ligase family protein [Propioniciclava sp. MC1683]